MNDQQAIDGYARFDQLLGKIGLAHQFRFLNWGYWPLEGHTDAADGPSPTASPSAPFERLLEELIAGSTLDQKRVLDIGCGRGGCLDYLLRTRRPLMTFGVDISPENVAACRVLLAGQRVRLTVGDACHLPFAPNSIDVALNLESSGAYPSMIDFLTSASHVLCDNGLFIFGDLMPAELVEPLDRAMTQVGLQRELHRDVTPQVLEARRRTAQAPLARMKNIDPVFFAQFEEFFAAPGTGLWTAMERGKVVYVLSTRRAGGRVSPVSDADLQILRRRDQLLDAAISSCS